VNFNSWGGVLRVARDICDDMGCFYSEEIVIPGETYEGPDFDLMGGGDGGGNGGGDDDPVENINAFFNPGATFLDNAIEWNLGPAIDSSMIAGYRVILFEVDPTSADPEPLSARLIEVPNTMSMVTLDQMLNGGTGITDITAAALAHVNESEGLAIIELTAANMVPEKTYVWLVEAFDDQDNDLGESNPVFLSPPPAN